MLVHVKLPTGDTLPLDLEPGDTIADIKTHVERERRFPEHRQGVLLDGTPLDDYERLRDCGIRDGSTVHVMMREFRAGMLHRTVRGGLSACVRVCASVCASALLMCGLDGLWPQSGRAGFRRLASKASKAKAPAARTRGTRSAAAASASASASTTRAAKRRKADEDDSSDSSESDGSSSSSYSGSSFSDSDSSFGKRRPVRKVAVKRK
jgi:hypothetical protein